MTEESYQQGRKLMQRANYLRGMITVAEGFVAKYTKLEDWNRREKKESIANAVKKKLDKALIKLEDSRKKFAELKFPDPDLKSEKEKTIACKICKEPTLAIRPICDSCLNL